MWPAARISVETAAGVDGRNDGRADAHVANEMHCSGECGNGGRPFPCAVRVVQALTMSGVPDAQVLRQTLAARERVLP